VIELGRSGNTGCGPMGEVFGEGACTTTFAFTYPLEGLGIDFADVINQGRNGSNHEVVGSVAYGFIVPYFSRFVHN